MPDPAPDYYNRLLEQRRAEYAAKGLSKIPPDFLGATSRYLGSLRELLERETRENPTSKKVEMTRVTYQRALASARDVLEARLAKIAHLAAQHVNLGGEASNLLSEERSLYDALTRDLAGFRRTSASFLDPSGASPSGPAPSAPSGGPSAHAATAPTPTPTPSTRTNAPSSPASTASVAGSVISSPLASSGLRASTGASVPSAGSTAGPEGTVLRILQDRPALALSGENLEIRKEDLLVLPADKANLLIQAQVAQKVDYRPRPTVT